MIHLPPPWLSVFKDKKLLTNELIAGLSMGVLVIPQSLGYAMLAGLPPIYGLYASIVPTLVYAYIGASSVQAVGPVAVSAIMTSGALAGFAHHADYPVYASILAMMVGVILLIGRLAKLGFIVEFISMGVSAGFISAAAVLIVLSQLKGLIGLPISGSNLFDILSQAHATTSGSLVHLPTAMIGITALVLLLINRYRPKWFWGFLKSSDLASKLFVVGVVALGIIFSRTFDWHHNIKTLSDLPPNLGLGSLYTFDSRAFLEAIGNPEILGSLFPSALLIALIGFISTSAVSQAQAQKREQRYFPNRELVGLSGANFASALFGGFPVSGGISRTSLNIALGAKSPLASVITACVIAVILVSFGTLLTGLPYAILSAIIISSAFGMIQFDTLKEAFHHDKTDMVAFLVAFFGVCIFGLNVGLVAGLCVSFIGLIYRSHHVHLAVVGQVGDSEHFRNIKRHSVRTFDNITLIRIDESLYFGNSQLVYQAILAQANTPHIVLIMTAINHIDLTAQKMLATLDNTLKSQNQTLHLSEVKGPVMDVIGNTPFVKGLSGQVFLSTIEAVHTLNAKLS